MIKYGGPGHKKQACIKRRCANPETCDFKPNPVAPSVKSPLITINPSTVKENTPVKITMGPNKKAIIQSTPKIEAVKVHEVPEAISETVIEEIEVPYMDRSYEEMPKIPVPPRSADRPKMSYSGLIAMAIQNSPGQKASLSEIYEWIEDAFPYFGRQHNKAGWQNSIRHNLSLHK